MRTEGMTGTCPDEAQLAAFIEGALDPSVIGGLTEHLAECDACRHLVAVGTRALPARAATLSSERYVLLHELGAGSMGVVYAAWDKRLDRRVALKMLHHDGVEDERQHRLEREARALARLSHPHVVTVYDVARSDDGLSIAMEYVDGRTMRQWLAEAPRGVSEVLSVFQAAGAGLLAAHEAGLVHRDFKPDNVLIGRDGRVRVSDFGLAHLGEEARAAPVTSVGLLSLTRSGVAVGTPAYMAPEALRGGAIDARSDQFSFCVALWEALTGRRPFAGRTVEDLTRDIASARLPAAPSLSRRLVQALRRGLSAEPSQRFPSMRALLDAIAPHAFRRRWVVLGLALASAAIATALALPRVDACAGAPALMEPVWNGARAQALSAALTAHGRETASVDRLVATWAQGWVAARTEACRATQRREQSETLLDQRMQCFDAQLQDARALLDALATADAALANRAVEAVSSLPPVGACAGARLSQRVPLPADRARLDQLTDELARLRAAAQRGQFSEAAKGAEALVSAARGLNYAPLVAAALVLQGTMLERLNDFSRSNEVLVEALAEATRGRDDEQAVAALTQLAYVTGFRRSNLQQGLEWVTLARALLGRLGGAVRPEAELEASHSIVLREAGRLPQALEHEERRARLLASLGPAGAIGLAESMVRRGRLLSDLGKYAEARTLLEEALAAQKTLLGAAHPDLAATLNPLSMACRRNGDLDCAVRAGEEALAVGVAALGPEALEVGYTLNHLGNVYAVRGEWPRAHETFVRVVALGEKHLGEHHEVGMAHANRSWSLRWLRRLDEAEAACARAEALVLPRLGPQHPYSLEVRRLRANLTRVRGAPQDAVTLQQRLLVDVEKALGSDSELRAGVLSELGVALLALGRRVEAATALGEASLHLLGSTTTAEAGEVKLALGVARGDCALALEGRRALEAGGAAPNEWAPAAAFLQQCSLAP